MKRNFLLLSAFFLSSCALDNYQLNSQCPVAYGREFSVRFEYGSAELNENAVRELTAIAAEAKEKNASVCFLGKLSYRGVPSSQALGAIDRVKETAAIFLRQGVSPDKLFIGLYPQKGQFGFKNPQTAGDEKHLLNILIGN